MVAESDAFDQTKFFSIFLDFEPAILRTWSLYYRANQSWLDLRTDQNKEKCQNPFKNEKTLL